MGEQGPAGTLKQEIKNPKWGMQNWKCRTDYRAAGGAPRRRDLWYVDVRAQFWR